MTLTESSFEKIYRSEQDVKAKERMLLVLNVVYHGIVASHVAKDLHRNRSWASVWLKRYDKEGIQGLKDKPKSGRRSQIPERTELGIKSILKESNQGWTTKQIEKLIIKETGIKYHYTHIYRILRRWGSRQKVPRKIHVNKLHLQKRKTSSKKDRTDTCGCTIRKAKGRVCHSITG